MHAFLLIGAGGLVGANVRYAVTRWASARSGSLFPYGTLIANLFGCFAIGLFFGVLTSQYSSDVDTKLFVATGFLGAETTFSTFASDTVLLSRAGRRPSAIFYFAGSVLVGFALTAVGLALADVIVGVA
jgi:CrcB protein